MAKKEKERRDVIIRGVTEDFIKERGGQIWIRNNIRNFALYFVAMLALLVAYDNIEFQGIIFLIVLFVGFGGVYIYGAVRFIKASNKYWERFKNNPQPIELPLLPKVTWKFWKKVS